MAVKAGFVYKLADKYYRNVIKKEIELAGITKKDHILCIGGGICPFSAILFHQITGAKVTVIDNNEKCVPKAKLMINRLGIGEKVRILHQDATGTDVNDYTVIHFALQVSPMEKAFATIEKQAVSGTRLLVRRPKKQTECLFSHCPCVTHKSRNIGSTVLYTKAS
jgi:protein-L-isoaspartate O-methyltransferase